MGTVYCTTDTMTDRWLDYIIASGGIILMGSDHSSWYLDKCHVSVHLHNNIKIDIGLMLDKTENE